MTMLTNDKEMCDEIFSHCDRALESYRTVEVSYSSKLSRQQDTVHEMFTTMLASMMFGSVHSDSIKRILMPRCFVKYS